MGNANQNEMAIKAESRLKIIFRTSVVAIIGNIAIGIFKAIVGIISNSIAITMDAINNFTDAGSSLVTIFSSYFATKEPNKKHPFGYGRIEYLGTLLIAVLILYAGITSFIESVKMIIHPEAAEYSAISLLIIVVAVIAKTVLAIYITKSGKKAGSDSLVAAGKEAIGDIAVSAATVVAALIYIYAHFSVEAWLGAVIAILIVKAGIEILMETIGKILGTGGDAELVKNIKKAIVAHEEVKGAYDLVLHDYGPDSYLASVHVEVDDTMDLNHYDELSRKIQADVLEQFGVYLTAVGVYSVNTGDARLIAIREDVKTIVLATEHVNQVHGFYLDETAGNMRFDMVISFEADDRRKVHDEAIRKVKEKYPDYTVSAGIDTDYNEI